MENKPDSREQLFEKFLEFEKSNTKNYNDKHKTKDFELTLRQANWLNLFLMLLGSLAFEYLTNNILFLNSYSLFSYLFECVIIGIIILRLIDEFAFKEIDTFSNWNENPIAKSIYISAVTIAISIIILATSGTVVFKPNQRETESSSQSNQTQIIEKHYYENDKSSSKNGLDTTQFSTSTKEN